jgi:hypothetical protein
MKFAEWVAHLYIMGGHLRSTTFEQLRTQPNDVATPGNFLELLLWNIFQYRRHIFFRCHQYPEISVPLRQTLFL